MEKIDGGSAFPRTNTAGMTEHKGMSLRDWFASQALIALAGKNLSDTEGIETAKQAYMFADTMIYARKEDSQCKDAGGEK